MLMLVVTPVTADATSAGALFFAYPTAVWRARGQLEDVLVRGWISHRANRTAVRSIVIAIGFVASAYYFWKLFGPTVMRAGAE